MTGTYTVLINHQTQRGAQVYWAERKRVEPDPGCTGGGIEDRKQRHRFTLMSLLSPRKFISQQTGCFLPNWPLLK